MENYRELIEEKLDNVILQHSYSRNREKRVGSEYVEFIDWLVEELDRAREEGRKERTDELKQAFHEVFYKSGELWFNYIFEDGDTKAEQEAKGVVEDYWDEIISKLRTKEDEEKNREDTG